MTEKVLAEANIAKGTTVIRVTRDEVGDYYITLTEGEHSVRHVYPSLLKAMSEFVDAVVQEEIETRAAGVS